MSSDMGKSFCTVPSAFREPVSSTGIVQDHTGTLSRGERIVITLMVLMICLLIGVAVFKDRRERCGRIRHVNDSPAKSVNSSEFELCASSRRGS